MRIMRWFMPAIFVPPLLVGLLILSPAAVALSAEDGDSQPGGDALSNRAGGQVRDPEGIFNLDIEQLARVNVSVVAPTMSTEVISVSKQESTIAHTPAAIYVITSEMIQRSPANNIPDLLRMVPGVEVARIDAHTWAITIRGDNDRFTNKVLVLVDWRSVYTPITGGVNWDSLELMLEDIERIEVTRGPNGTLWGANAVNGMINIITKKAKDSQGVLVTYGGGTEDRAIGGARYGGMIGDDFRYRVYGKEIEEAPGFRSDGKAYDDWRQGRAGFRADWDPGLDKANQFTVQGDYYTGTEGVSGDVASMVSPYHQNVIINEQVEGGDILARWTHTIDVDSDWMLQSSFDREKRTNSIWGPDVNNFDVEFQHRFPMGERNELIWGTEYRLTHDTEMCDGFVVNFDPLSRTTQVLDFFVQDQVTLVEEKLFFIAGTKLGRNDYTGFDYQPTARLLFTPDKTHSAWMAVSRAVGTASRFTTNGAANQGYVGQVFGHRTYVEAVGPEGPYMADAGWPGITSEHLMAYELGYRAEVNAKFAYDIALYYYKYDNLRLSKQGTPFTDVYNNLIIPYVFVDGADGRNDAFAYGAEVGGQWTPSETWRLSGSYGHLETTYNAGKSPPNQVKCVSSWDLGSHWQFDATLRYVDYLDSVDVPSYLTMDCRLAWQPRKNVEFAIMGRNLLQNHHWEFGPTNYPYYVTEVSRSVFGKVTWRY